jgi:hypothetical protein
MPKSLERLTPGVVNIKLFWRQFTDTFCELDYFIAVNNFSRSAL